MSVDIAQKKLMHKSAGMDKDRFSTLSEQLCHHILSFLGIEDFCGLIPVSRRCKSLCVSVPCLTVDNRNFMNDQTYRQKFNKFVGNFLDLRAKSGIKTQEVTFFWSFEGSSTLVEEYGTVFKWFEELSIGGGAERLSISMVPAKGMQNNFPASVFRSKSLKDLMFCSNGYVMFFPRQLNVFQETLESLTLQSAQIIVDVFSLVFYMLKGLKSLYLYDCSGKDKIFVKSDSLEVLKIINDKPVDDLSIVNVDAPKLEKFFLTWYPTAKARQKWAALVMKSKALQHFVWYGYPVRVSYACRRLQFAAFYFTIPPEWSRVKCYAGLDITRNLLPMSESSLKFFRLNPESIRVLFKLGEVTERLETVRNLAIDYCLLTDDQVPIIASFLKGISLLETLYLTSSGNNSKACNMVPSEVIGFQFNVEYWENQELKFIDKLRKATVEIHGEKGNDVELVKYILKHARALEDLTIACQPSLQSIISEFLTAYMNGAFTCKLNFYLKKPLRGQSG